MRYDEWQLGIPDEIKGDSLWKLEVYRMGLFISDIAWQDALELNKNHLTRGIVLPINSTALCVPFRQTLPRDILVPPEKIAPAFLNIP